ncbi:aspartate-semialdehyde dehydrogenase [bacterium]|nr:aspartate-semialdehyde dehydrogenase [bacterium]
MYTVAVVGATGVVGQEFLSILEEREFPIRQVRLFASARSKGLTLTFKGAEIPVEELSKEADLSGIQIVLSSPGASVSREFMPLFGKAGAVVIDNTSAFRMEPDVPLVVPEVNGSAAKNHPRNIIANPNCSTIQMVVALKPIHDLAKVTRVVVSSYQSVSGAGSRAIYELEAQVNAFVQGIEAPPPEKFAHPIAFNCIPQIDVFMENRFTKEEMKMVNETHKILDPNIRVTATCVRVPVFRGHAESVYVETEKKVSVEDVRGAMSRMPGLEIVDNPANKEYPLQVYSEGRDPVYVGRLRGDTGSDRAFNMWVVSDNIRKGAALNAVQIAELLVEKKWL